MKILQIGAPSFLPAKVDQNVRDLESLRNLLSMVGGNTGNCYIGYSVKSIINEINNFNCEIIQIKMSDLLKKNTSYLRTFNLIVYGAANIFTNKGIQGEITKKIIKSKTPLAIFGIGAQLPSTSYINTVNINKNILKIVHYALETSGVVTTRGHITSNIMSRYGISGHLTLGCPSLYYKSSDFENYSNEDGKLLLVTKRDRNTYQQDIYTHELINKIIYECGILNLDIFCQAEFADLAFARHQLIGPDKLTTQKKNIIKSYHLSRFKKDNIELFMSGNFKSATNYDDWKKLIQSHDYSCCISFRIHGAIFALNHGLKTLCITHDTRTEELCEIGSVPNISVQVARNMSFHELKSLCAIKKYTHNYDINRTKKLSALRGLL